jgi:hypothetical protein
MIYPERTLDQEFPWPLKEGECKAQVNDGTSIQIGDKIYEVEGKYLVCRNIGTGEECFRKSFKHEQYETLRDLNIWEVYASPDGKDIIVLFEISPPGYKTEGNLACVTLTGEVKWWAELPDTGRDSYVSIGLSGNSVVAQSRHGYRCDIDPHTGRIVSRTFTK